MPTTIVARIKPEDATLRCGRRRGSGDCGVILARLREPYGPDGSYRLSPAEFAFPFHRDSSGLWRLGRRARQRYERDLRVAQSVISRQAAAEASARLRAGVSARDRRPGDPALGEAVIPGDLVACPRCGGHNALPPALRLTAPLASSA
jgi:hypothetical protein